MSFFSGQPRAQQTEILRTIEAGWKDYDVFVVKAPVATGKSRIAATIQRWAGAAIIMPSNLLQGQYVAEFPEVPTLWRKSLYHCETYDVACTEVKRIKKHQCKGCVCVQATKEAKRARSVIVNYYTYMAHELWNKHLVVDEAHQILGAIQDLSAKKLWYREYRWPHSVRTLGDLASWLEDMPDAEKDEKLKLLESELKSLSPATLVHLTVEELRGVEERVMKLIPIDTEHSAPYFWHSSTRKIVLMSATISERDVKQMGLAGRRVAYIDVDSPIPAASRPIYYTPVANMGAKHQDQVLPALLAALSDLAAQHPGMKGLIHSPYSLARKIQDHWDNPRALYHTKSSKMDVYTQFRESAPEAGRILVSSGMYEGIDLVEDAGRFQIITKVPFPNLGEPGVRAKLERDKGWFAWEALRDILQASGRICRTPDDWGITYIIDSNMEMLYKQNKELIPAWFRSALIGL